MYNLKNTVKKKECEINWSHIYILYTVYGIYKNQGSDSSF